MTVKEAQALIPGDQVYFIDPDDGTLLAILTLRAIQIDGEMATIMDTNGDVLECLTCELANRSALREVQ